MTDIVLAGDDPCNRDAGERRCVVLAKTITIMLICTQVRVYIQGC